MTPDELKKQFWKDVIFAMGLAAENAARELEAAPDENKPAIRKRFNRYGRRIEEAHFKLANVGKDAPAGVGQ